MWYKQNHLKQQQFQSLQQQYFQQSDQELQPSSHVPIPTMDDYERSKEVYREYGYRDIMKDSQKIQDVRRGGSRGEYQLTFKKEKGGIDRLSGDFGYARQRLFDAQNPQQQRHKQDQNSEWSLVLTTIRSKKNIPQILKTLTQTHQTPTSLLSHLLQFQKISHHLLNNQSTTKLESLIIILSLKIYRKKRINAKLNLQYIRLILEEFKDKDISQADKKKQQLLKMLIWQLQKKILVLGLRYNRVGMGMGVKGGVLSEGEDNYEGEGLNLEGYGNFGKYTNRTQKEIQTKRQQDIFMDRQKNMIGNVNSNPCYHQSTRLSFFSQILTSLVNKSVFSAFRKLSETLYEKQTHYNEHEHEQEYDNEQQYGHYQQNERKQQSAQNKDLDYQDESLNSQTDNQQDPIQSITYYINSLKQKLKHFPRNEHEILNNYFIKWKIYFLYQIISKIEEENNYINQDITNQYAYSNANTKANTNTNTKINRNRNGNGNGNGNQQDYVDLQQYGSVRDADGDLKEEKSVLKRYLRVRSARSVFRVLAENRANRSIKDVMRGYYARTLQRKAFTAIFINKQQAQIQKYAQQIAQNQQQHHQTTSKIFFKTTTLTKSFFALKKLTKHSKFFKILQKFLISHIFTDLKHNSIKQKQNEQKQYKLHVRKNKTLLFMCFHAIKNQTSFSQYRQTVVENFRRKRELEVMEFCFSGLKLEIKKRLLTRRKIQNFVGVNNVRRFFSNLRQNFISMSDYESRSHVVHKFVAAYKKLMFFQHFRKYAADRKVDKRLQIKGLKLDMQKIRRKAKQSLGRWRKQAICRKNYRVVELKLKKVKQVEAKQRIFLIWFNRLRQKHRDERKDRLTNDHKIWLNKYYQRLCALEQQQP